MQVEGLYQEISGQGVSGIGPRAVAVRKLLYSYGFLLWSVS